jgi:hypothetical protein
MATVWAVTRLSFVVDWFYNIGGAIENLQGSLTHDIEVTDICVSDRRTRKLVTSFEGLGVGQVLDIGAEMQTYYSRNSYSAAVPFLPAFKLPQKPMQYALLGLLALVNTKKGGLVLSTLDKHLDLSPKVKRKIMGAVAKLGPEDRKSLAHLIGTPK